MPSILSNNNIAAPENTKQDPVSIVKTIANQIMSSVNPQQAFNQVLESSPDAKNAMNLINQYGNGDPKVAFMNYAAATGKQDFAQQISQKLGLG